jgi:hypothetical protein
VHCKKAAISGLPDKIITIIIIDAVVVGFGIGAIRDANDVVPVAPVGQVPSQGCLNQTPYSALRQC